MSSESKQSAGSRKKVDEKGGRKVTTGVSLPIEDDAGSVKSKGSANSQGKEAGGGGSVKSNVWGGSVKSKSAKGSAVSDKSKEGGGGSVGKDSKGNGGTSEVTSKEPDDASQLTAETGDNMDMDIPKTALQKVKATLSRYCCCGCLKRDLKVSPEGAENPLKVAPVRDKKEVPQYVLVRRFEEKWEEEVFWPKFWKNYLSKCQHHDSAIQIQRIARGWLGRCSYDRHLREALDEMNRFWDFFSDMKMLAREKKRIERETRQKLAIDIARNTLWQCTSRKARRDAASTIQRAWRGMVGRSIASYFKMLAKELRIKKPRPPPSRIKVEALRRIWARKNFEPKDGLGEGKDGYPGKADFVHFDMWEYTDRPPAGNKYGLKTHKISAAPTNEIDKNRLLGDKNAWVGIPVGIVSTEEAKKPLPERIVDFKQTSPYNAAVVKHDPSLTAPKRLTGLQTLYSLGWKNPIHEARLKAKKEQLSGGAAPDGGVNIFNTLGSGSKYTLAATTAHTVGANDVSSPTKWHDGRSSNILSPGRPTLGRRGRDLESSPPRVQTASANPRSLAQTRVSTAEEEDRRQRRRLESAGVSTIVTGGGGCSSQYNTAHIDAPFSTSNFGSDTYQDTLRYQYSALTAGPSSGGGNGSPLRGVYPALSSLNAPGGSSGNAPTSPVRGSAAAPGQSVPLDRSGASLSAGPLFRTGAAPHRTTRGATKPVMGRPTAVGSLTAELAEGAGKLSIQAMARAQERHLLHLTQDLDPSDKNGSMPPRGIQQLSVDSNSFLTDGGKSSFRGSGDVRPKKPQRNTGSSPYQPGNSSWSKLRSEVSSLTGRRSGFKSDSGGGGSDNAFIDTWSGTLHGLESPAADGGNSPAYGKHPRSTRRDLEARERPWPVRTTTQFKMRYSWLAQPMVQEAAGQVYEDEMRLKREREAAELARRNAKKKKVPFLQRLKAYNPDDVSSVSSLTELQNFQKTTALSIRDERLRQEPLKHPYPWA